jgi:hypothetical protein
LVMVQISHFLLSGLAIPSNGIYKNHQLVEHLHSS